MTDIQDLDPLDDNNQAQWPEGTMQINQVNDAGRADEGIMARWYIDINATIITAGTADEYTITPSRTVNALLDGLTFRVTLDRANTTTTPTLKIGALAAAPIKTNLGADPAIGSLAAGTIVEFIYQTPNFIYLPIGLGDPNVLKKNETATLEVGYDSTPNDIGDTGAGTVTPDFALGQIQNMTITGSFTLAPPAGNAASMVIFATNDATGGYSPDYTTNYTVLFDDYNAAANAINQFMVYSNGVVNTLQVVRITP